MAYCIREVLPDDLSVCTLIETLGFPPAEGASRESIAARIEAYPSHFLVAEDACGVPVGYIMGAVTDSETITDDMFESTACHKEDGAYQAIFSVCVHPADRRHGVAAALIEEFCACAKAQGRHGVTLTCKKEKIEYYSRFGFRLLGVAASVHGGAVWYDMVLEF